MSRLAIRPRVDHKSVAGRLRETPGVWEIVGTYRSRYSAEGIAHRIRTAGGQLAAYLPAGSFEARVEYVDGDPTVYGRYIGDGTEPSMWRDGRRLTKHEAAAASLRDQPGVELPISTHRSLGSAAAIASQVRRGAICAYQPAGSCEARWALNADRSGWTVYGRYVGAAVTDAPATDWHSRSAPQARRASRPSEMPTRRQ
jgi:hypothetical protein